MRDLNFNQIKELISQGKFIYEGMPERNEIFQDIADLNAGKKEILTLHVKRAMEEEDDQPLKIISKSEVQKLRKVRKL